MRKAHRVYLGIGSNLDRKRNISSCLHFLEASFKRNIQSPIYQSAAQGFDGNDFYNLVVEVDTHFDLSDLKHWLMKLENKHGRDRSLPRYSDKTLDIDLLLFDDITLNHNNLVIPRPDILTQAYVLKPLADIAADLKHPLTHQSIRQHWQKMQAIQTVVMTQVHI